MTYLDIVAEPSISCSSMLDKLNLSYFVVTDVTGLDDKQAVVDVLTDFAVENFGAEREFICIALNDLAMSDVAHGGHLFG